MAKFGPLQYNLLRAEQKTSSRIQQLINKNKLRLRDGKLSRQEFQKAHTRLQGELADSKKAISSIKAMESFETNSSLAAGIRGLEALKTFKVG